MILHPEEKFRVVNAGEHDLFYRNDGGHFVEVSAELGIDGMDEGLSAVWFDYDRDGWPDLYVANDFYGPDRLYRNLQGKYFEEVTDSALPHVPWFSMGADSADINNDGWPDLMTSDMAGSNHYKAKMGMGDMADRGWFLRSSNPKQYMRNSLFLNAGKGRFLEVAQQAGLASTDWTWSVKFGDIDNDLDYDFLISGYSFDGYKTLLYENKRLLDDNGAVVQPMEVYFEENESINFVSVKEGTTQFVDFDADGKLA